MVEVENGILGVKRDILMSLVNLMIFRKDSIQNLIGISGESVNWINHFHFVVARTLCEKHLERHIIPSKKERGKEITIKLRNIIFNLISIRRSILINILIKNTILKCTFKINRDIRSLFCYCLYYIYHCCCLYFYVGICTPNQVNDVVVKSLSLGSKDCGGSFEFSSSYSNILCCGNYSPPLKEGGIEEGKEEEITTVVNNKNVNNGGRMNIIRNQKRVPHVIVNIPKDGVYFGFSFWGESSTLSIISLIHINILPPSFDNGMKCIAYNFHGGFGNSSKDYPISNIGEYFNVKE